MSSTSSALDYHIIASELLANFGLNNPACNLTSNNYLEFKSGWSGSSFAPSCASTLEFLKFKAIPQINSMVGLIYLVYAFSKLTSLVSRVVRLVAKLDLVMLIKAI